MAPINHKSIKMKQKIIILFIGVLAVACSNKNHADFKKNTETAKAYFKLHEQEDAEAMFPYLHEDIQWQMPAYGSKLVSLEEVKGAILGYQAAFDDMKFTAEAWLPGVDTETGALDGSTRVYGTWNCINTKTGKEVNLTSYHSFEFKDGKIISGGDWFDLGGMMNAVAYKNLVIAEFKILPGKEKEVFAAMENKEIGLDLTRNYKGCNSLVTTYNEDSNTFWVVSDWDSYDDYNAYLEWRTNEFPALGEALVPLLKNGLEGGFRPVFPNSDYKIY